MQQQIYSSCQMQQQPRFVICLHHLLSIIASISQFYEKIAAAAETDSSTIRGSNQRLLDPSERGLFRRVRPSACDPSTSRSPAAALDSSPPSTSNPVDVLVHRWTGIVIRISPTGSFQQLFYIKWRFRTLERDVQLLLIFVILF